MNEYKVGDIYVECCGYSMTLYRFWKIVRVTDKSIFVAQCEKNIHPDTTDGMRPLVVPDVYSYGKAVRKKMGAYIGHPWDGNPCQEDHMD